MGELRRRLGPVLQIEDLGEDDAAFPRILADQNGIMEYAGVLEDGRLLEALYRGGELQLLMGVERRGCMDMRYE